MTIEFMFIEVPTACFAGSPIRPPVFLGSTGGPRDLGNFHTSMLVYAYEQT